MKEWHSWSSPRQQSDDSGHIPPYPGILMLSGFRGNKRAGSWKLKWKLMSTLMFSQRWFSIFKILISPSNVIQRGPSSYTKRLIIKFILSWFNLLFEYVSPRVILWTPEKWMNVFHLLDQSLVRGHSGHFPPAFSRISRMAASQSGLKCLLRRWLSSNGSDVKVLLQ